MLIKVFQKYFDEDVLDVRDLEHMGNNKLFEITTSVRRYLLKKYSKLHLDNWNRGETEFNSLSYLWGKSFREIPSPLIFYEKDNVAIYSYENGRALEPLHIKKEEIDKAVDFLVKLHELSNNDKKRFGPASSACFCLKDYLDVIDRRIDRAMGDIPKTQIEIKARNFLDKSIVPRMLKLKRDFLKECERSDLKKVLSLDEQVLTPADFGFHNILVDEYGNYKFLDFEYFGRDDPTRQILDFYHHDKSSKINKNLRDYFLKSYIEKRGLSKNFEERVRILDPLIAMTWVLIPLNVLAKKQMKHIRATQKHTPNLIEDRLKKAERKLKEMFN